MNVPLSTFRVRGGATRRLSMRANFVWSLAGNATYAAAQWLAVVAIARRGDANAVGAYALALAISSPVFALVNLHLRTVQVTDAKQEYRFEDYLGLRVLTLGMAILVMGGAAAYGPMSVLAKEILLAVTFGRAAEAVSDIVYGSQQQAHQMDRVGRSMVSRAAGSLALLSGLLLAGLGPIVAVWGWSLFSALITVWDLVGLRRDTGKFPAPAFRLRTLNRLAATSAGLGGTMLISSLNFNGPRLLLGYWRPESEVGVFSAILLLVTSANVVVLALGQAAAPVLSRACAAGDFAAFRRGAARVLGPTVALGVIVAAGGLIFGPALTAAVYGPEYGRRGALIAVLSLGGALGYGSAACGFVLSSARWFGQQIGPLLLVAAVTSLLCSWLIPKWGVMGAALAQVGSFAVQLAVSLYMLKHCLQRQFGRNAFA